MRTCEASASTVYVSFLTKFLQEATRVLGKACWVSRVSKRVVIANIVYFDFAEWLGGQSSFCAILSWMNHEFFGLTYCFISIFQHVPSRFHSFSAKFYSFSVRFHPIIPSSLSSHLFTYYMISQSFSSALLERSIQVSSLFMTKKEGVQSATAPRRSVLVLISVSVHSRKSGRARSYNQSFPTKLSKYRLENGWTWVTWGNTPWDSHKDYWWISSCIPMLGLVNLPFSMGWMFGLTEIDTQNVNDAKQ